MSRVLAREYAMNCLYQLEMKQEFEIGAVEYYMNSVCIEEKELNYVKSIVTNFLETMESIDLIITQHLKGWKLDRIAKVDLAIIRLAIVEIQTFEDIPVSVSINEAINLGKKFNDEESGQFINGVLGKIVIDLGV
jgi:N utilization substance protein B